MKRRVAKLEQELRGLYRRAFPPMQVMAGPYGNKHYRWRSFTAQRSGFGHLCEAAVILFGFRIEWWGDSKTGKTVHWVFRRAS